MKTDFFAPDTDKMTFKEIDGIQKTIFGIFVFFLVLFVSTYFLPLIVCPVIGATPHPLFFFVGVYALFSSLFTLVCFVFSGFGYVPDCPTFEE